MNRFAICVSAVLITSLVTVSGHVVRGILNPSAATAFVSSPSAAEDVPIPIRWGTDDTGQRVACFNVSNTSPALPSTPGYPRVAAFGFELPGAPSGFSLLGGGTDWQVLHSVPASLLGRGHVTLDVVLLARGAGLPPAQAATRAGGTKFCLSGPFPDGFTIEQLINGVAIGFQSQAGGAIVDIGLWESPQRIIPLHP
jgi:hypothetical protein